MWGSELQGVVHLRRAAVITICCLGLAACVPGEPVERGPAFAFEGTRVAGSVTMTVRYRDGGAIPADDVARAVTASESVSCREGETVIPDQSRREDGAVIVELFCVSVVESDEVVSTAGIT